MGNRIVWVDIPVRDMDRAARFYAAILDAPVPRFDTPGMPLAVLPHGDGETSGCLYQLEGAEPSASGSLVYLSVEGRLRAAVAQVEPLGGRVVSPPHGIGQHGHRAVIIDSEGNRVALHSHAAP